jgi:hypothetical protein
VPVNSILVENHIAGALGKVSVRAASRASAHRRLSGVVMLAGGAGVAARCRG